MSRALVRLARRRCVGVALSFAVFAASPARAQDAAGKAAAEALFERGVELMKAGRFTEACPKLESSQRVDPGVGTLLYLAECYERTGRTASAWATFREAQSLASAQNQLERTRTAQARAQKLEGELAYLTVTVPPEARVEGLVVRRGTTPVVPELYGIAAPVDPGAIEIEASAPGHRSYTAQIRVTARAKESVTIPRLEPLPQAEPPPAAPATSPDASSGVPGEPSSPPPAAPPAEREPRGRNHTLAYVIGSAGLVGIGLGSYFGLRAMSKNSDAEASCNERNVCTDPRALALTEDAKSAATVSNVAFALGGAALATAVVLIVIAPGGDEENAVTIAPSVARGGGGLSVGGSFR